MILSAMEMNLEVDLDGARQIKERRAGTKHQDAEAARILNQEVKGNVLAVGGVWDFFEPSNEVRGLIVLDISQDMLRYYTPVNAQGILGDFYKYDFSPSEFDSVVFPLMLHHVAQGTWRECERRITEAILRAQRVLKPGGKIFILEYCPQRFWYPLQRGLLPITRKFLTFFNVPLVVLHSRSFYENELQRSGFELVQTYRPVPQEESPWAWYPIFMGIDWLRIPIFIYPKMHLFVAQKRS